MMDKIITILIAVLSSGLIQFFFNRYDKKNDKLSVIDKKLDEIQKVSTRTQLMTLIADFPEREEEIMKVAHMYFVDMEGNFYLSTLFRDYLDKHKINKPSWFNN